MLNFKQIFLPSFEKIVMGILVFRGRGCASKTWSFSSASKNLGARHPLVAEIWFSEQIDLGMYDFTA